MLRLSPPWLLFWVALALRMGWVSYSWVTSTTDFAYDDEALHWQLAENLVNKGALVSDDGRYAARMPAYPLLLASTAWIGHSGLLLARLLQCVLGAATVAVAYRFADLALGRWPAVLVGALACFDPFAVFFANLLLTEVLFTLWAVSTTTCAWLWLRTRGRSRLALAGTAVLGAAAIMTRPSSVAWIPLLWLLMAWLARDRRRMVPQLLLCPAVLVLMLLPWGIRNKAVLGSYAWLSANGGVTLYDAQGPQADGSSNQEFLQDPEVRRRLAGLDNEVARDRVLQRMALHQMWQHPGNVLRLAGVKFLRTWNPVPNVAEYSSGPAAVASAVYTLGLLALAATGLVRTWLNTRHRGPETKDHRRLRRDRSWRPPGRWGYLALVWLPVVAFTLLHCIYIGSVRYRVPLMPFLALAGGTALCGKAYCRRRRWIRNSTRALSNGTDVSSGT